MPMPQSKWLSFVVDGGDEDHLRLQRWLMAAAAMKSLLSPSITMTGWWLTACCCHRHRCQCCHHHTLALASFAVAVNNNDRVVAAASTAASQSRTTTAIAADGGGSINCRCTVVVAISSILPPSTKPAIAADAIARRCGRGRGWPEDVITTAKTPSPLPPSTDIAAQPLLPCSVPPPPLKTTTAISTKPLQWTLTSPQPPLLPLPSPLHLLQPLPPSSPSQLLSPLLSLPPSLAFSAAITIVVVATVATATAAAAAADAAATTPSPLHPLSLLLQPPPMSLHLQRSC